MPFFQSDKLGVYNGAINLYSQKQIGNCHKIADFYETVLCMNQVDEAEPSMHNTSIFEDLDAGKKPDRASSKSNIL